MNYLNPAEFALWMLSLSRRELSMFRLYCELTAIAFPHDVRRSMHEARKLFMDAEQEAIDRALIDATDDGQKH